MVLAYGGTHHRADEILRAFLQHKIRKTENASRNSTAQPPIRGFNDLADILLQFLNVAGKLTR